MHYNVKIISNFALPDMNVATVKRWQYNFFWFVENNCIQLMKRILASAAMGLVTPKAFYSYKKLRFTHLYK